MTPLEIFWIIYFIVGGYVTGRVLYACINDLNHEDKTSDSLGWLISACIIWLIWPVIIGFYHARKLAKLHNTKKPDKLIEK